MTDVTALGELLIDFTPSGVSEHGAALYARNAGGAPANVLAMLSRLGRSTQLIARVGQDAFGRFLRETLEQCGVGCRGIVAGPETTTLAFVQLDKQENGPLRFIEARICCLQRSRCRWN